MQSVIDPVCGMAIDPDTAAAQTKFEGRDYYFCSMACKTEFEKNPDRYRHADSSGAPVSRDADDPPWTQTGPLVAPKFGAAGSGGAEYEPLPHEKRKT